MTGTRLPFTNAILSIQSNDLARNGAHQKTHVHISGPRRGPLILLFLSLLLLTGCIADSSIVDEVMPVATVERDLYLPGIEPLAQATSTTLSDESEPPTVTVQNRSVNIRSGPGLDFQVVAGAVNGDSFTTSGKTEDGWWHICCLVGPSDTLDKPTQKAWISARTVRPGEMAAALPTLTPLFPEDLTASWDVEYECRSERCAVSACTARANAAVHSSRDLRWLEINRSVTWDETCGENSTWLHQVDRIEGTERYQNSTGLFWFNYWVGARPGVVNARFRLDSGEAVEVWCSDEQGAEVEEESGWTTVYTGVTCHDIRTGMLLSMQYTKRWLFTGEFEGERYERAYFGDFEIYKVKLDSTNALLATSSESTTDSNTRADDAQEE